MYYLLLPLGLLLVLIGLLIVRLGLLLVPLGHLLLLPGSAVAHPNQVGAVMARVPRAKSVRRVTTRVTRARVEIVRVPGHTSIVVRI